MSRPATSAPSRPRRPAALSDLLLSLAHDESRERISVGDLAEAMRDHALAALMFVLAAPNILPSPPGTSIVVGPPLVLLSMQLMRRRPLRLPAAIASRGATRIRFLAWVERLAPWLARMERLLKPRLAAAAAPPADRIVGALCLVLAAILFLPLPLGNVLPALAICVMSLGLLERDGLWVLAGGATALAAVGVIGGVLWAMIRLAWFVLAQMVTG